MPAHLPRQHNLFASGTDSNSTTPSGDLTIDTGLAHDVKFFDLTFQNSAGKDEAKFDWSNVDGQPGKVSVKILKADGSAADTAVNFTWFAYGF